MERKRRRGINRVGLIEDIAALRKGLYEERNKCIALSARMALKLGLNTGLMEADPQEDGWKYVVVIDLPSGQVSWHVPDADLGFFDFLEPYRGTWDGHTTEEKYKRVLHPGL